MSLIGLLREVGYCAGLLCISPEYQPSSRQLSLDVIQRETLASSDQGTVGQYQRIFLADSTSLISQCRKRQALINACRIVRDGTWHIPRSDEKGLFIALDLLSSIDLYNLPQISVCTKQATARSEPISANGLSSCIMGKLSIKPSKTTRAIFVNHPGIRTLVYYCRYTQGVGSSRTREVAVLILRAGHSAAAEMYTEAVVHGNRRNVIAALQLLSNESYYVLGRS